MRREQIIRKTIRQIENTQLRYPPLRSFVTVPGKAILSLSAFARRQPQPGYMILQYFRYGGNSPENVISYMEFVSVIEPERVRVTGTSHLSERNGELRNFELHCADN